MMLVTAIAVMAVLPAVAFRPMSAEEEWPGWRGPDRSGWVRGFEPPSPWPATLEQVWSVEVGTGYGSPLVSGNRVYQHARQGEEEVVWCLDLETGDVLWRESYPVPFRMGNGGERHGKGPKSTPVLAEGRIFTFSITGVLSAWDADSGERLWHRDYRDRFATTHPYWGASTSPLVDQNRVVVHFGTDGNGALIALDTATGDEVWSHGGDGPSYASPIVIDLHGVRQIVNWTQRALVSVDSESGRLLWEYPFPQERSDQNMPTPVFHQGMVFLGGENRGVHCLQPRLESGVWTVDHRWHQSDVALDMSSAVAQGPYLYGFSHYDAGRLFCLDVGSGEVQWQGPPRAGQNVMFLSIPDHIVALLDDGRLQILAAGGDEFREVASYRVSDASTWAPPVLLPHAVLIKDTETLTRWSLGTSTTAR